MNCLNCGKELVGRQRKFCSNSCKINLHRKEQIRLLKERAGGACVHCGYDKYLGALQFHHTDPKQKSFGISYNGRITSWDRACEEADKCDLVCANCHAEIHGGVL